MEHAVKLAAEFNKMYPDAREPAVCLAPGRINLIGEHIDYNGLPVLPMTIDRAITIAFAPRSDGMVQLRNVDPAFPPAQFRNSAEIEPSAPGSWDNYCKAAITGLNTHFDLSRFSGMDMLVTGTIPIASGLSSSSALVVACALACLGSMGKQLDKDISRLELASLLAEAEHYVGTKGGGMDHAIILLGEPHNALKIDFFPLRVEKIPLLKDHLVVACDSLTRVEKSGEARHRFNEGVVSCRLIRALVEKHAQKTFSDDLALERLGDLWHGNLCLTHAEVAALFEETFPKETYRIEEIGRALDMTPEEIQRRWLGDINPPAGGFKLRARARHQVTEYQRVEAARDALLAGDAGQFGALMNASHQSCARDFNVSSPKLDALVAIARESGAVGARLTGAGFGGCTVNLVPASSRRTFLERVETAYYQGYLGARAEDLPKDRTLIVQAGPGAGYPQSPA